MDAGSFPWVDVSSSIAICGAFAAAMAVFLISARLWGARSPERLDREEGLPIFGKRPIEAVYAAAMPVARALVSLGVSANAVTLTSAFLAAGAGALFAFGHFGLGVVVAVFACLADAIDGIVARESGTASRFGQVLDTTVDRYVEAMLIGGIAVFVREDAWLLALALAALVGAFMVSYASSVLRELGAADAGAPMRRVHRLSYLVAGVMIVPFVTALVPDAPLRVRLASVIVALGSIAVVGNISAVRRLLHAAREARGESDTARGPRGASGTAQGPRSAPGAARGPRSAPGSARMGRTGSGIDAAVASERHP